MKLFIDTDKRTLSIDGEQRGDIDLYSKEAFELISELWLKTSWNQKYPYTFTWLGRPIIQHPEDLIRLQEVIHELKPDVIIETGVAHGGSLVFCAGLLHAMGTNGRVIGVDIEIRPHNRAAIESHMLAPMITLVEGDSVAPEIVKAVAREIRPGQRVLVMLDSNHSAAHVGAELEAYCSLVSVGSYIVVTDGIMRQVAYTPRGKPDWIEDNPANAAESFVARRPEFEIVAPPWLFNESCLDKTITAWPSAWLKRRATKD